MTTLRNILRISAGILLTGYLALLFLANAAPAERWMARRAEHALGEKLGTKVSIGRMEIGLFNRIVLHDIAISDQQGEPLLTAGLASAKIEYRALLDHRVSLRSVSLLDADIRLYRQRRDSSTNVQFVLDAFKSDSKKPSHLDLTLGSVILRRCALRYDERYKAREAAHFDAAHIAVSELDASISLRRLTNDNLNLRIRHLSLKEHSGLELKHLQLRLAANRHRAVIHGFSLELPKTRLDEEQLTVNYDANAKGPLTASLQLSGSITGARVTTSDFCWLLPELAHYPFTLEANAAFHIDPRTIILRNVDVHESNDLFSIKGHSKLKPQEGAGSGACTVTISHRAVETAQHTLITTDSTRIKALPGQLLAVADALGDAQLRANWQISRDGVSHLISETTAAPGKLYAALHWRGNAYTLQAASAGLNPSCLIKNTLCPSNVAFYLDATAVASKNKGTLPIQQLTANARIERIDLNDRQYNNLTLSTTWDGQKISGGLAAADPRLFLNATWDGDFNGRKFSRLHLITDIENAEIPILKGNPTVAGHIEAAANEIDSPRPQGTLGITNFHYRRGDSIFRLSNFDFKVTPSLRGQHACLRSDFADADFDGDLSIVNVKRRLVDWYKETLLGENVPTSTNDAGNISVALNLYRDDIFRQLLGIPLSFPTENPITLQGTLSGDSRTFLQLSAPNVAYDGTAIEALRLYIGGTNGRANALLQGIKTFGETPIKFALSTDVHHGNIVNHLKWDDGDTHSATGAIATTTTVSRDYHGKYNVSTDVMPTALTINDTTWTLSAGNILWQAGSVNIDHLQLSHEAQSITVGGRLTGQPTDSMHVSLHDVDVSYILGIIELEPVSFAGPATGDIIARNIDGHTNVRALLHIPKFHFNDGLMGDAAIAGTFNTADKRLHLQADIKEEGVGFTMVRGYVGIGEKALDLSVTGKNTTLHFLRRYVPDMFEELTGRTTGHCRIHGPFKALDFEGREQANVFLRVGATGCSYHLKDGIVNISAGVFSFNNYTINDDNGGHGVANGELRHTHLKDIRYDFTIQANALKLYDEERSPDLPFYATATGSGTVTMNGYPGSFSADINVRPSRGTIFTYIVDNPSTDADGSLLRFTTGETTKHNETREHTLPVATPQGEEATTDIRLNFLIDMNPEAKLRVITDDKTGNNITLTGNGALRATFYNKGAFQMFGTYTVADGLYKLVIQDFLHKDLKFSEGGTIIFAGNPYEGDLNLRALYTVPSVSLSDLGLNLNDNTIRADCILNLTGKVQAPQITFDLNLPGVSDDVRQMVRQIVATDEDMNRQVLYLLGVGRFYNYNMAASDAGSSQSQGSLAMKSFLSSTLTGQLNSIISNAIGISDWTFGTNLSTGQLGWSDMEVAGLLSGRLLSGRLLVNGNFGYRDRTTSNTNFVGNFDINYLLTPRGTISLKAYSETNDRYFSKSSLTTQGIGITLRRDFRNLKDLFRRQGK